jgi:hypothetical protein
MKPVLEKYLSLWKTKVCDTEIEHIKYTNSHFKALRIRENNDPSNDEIFTGANGISPEAKTSRLNTFIQAVNVQIPGISLGYVAMSGILKCRYSRRQLSVNQSSTSQVVISPTQSNKIPLSPNGTRNMSGNTDLSVSPKPSLLVGESKTNSGENLQTRNRTYTSSSSSTQRTNNTNVIVNNPVTDDFLRKRSLSDEFVGPNGPGPDWKDQYAVLSEWQGRGRLLLFDPITAILNVVIYIDSLHEVHYFIFFNYLNFTISVVIVKDIDSRLYSKWNRLER